MSVCQLQCQVTCLEAIVDVKLNIVERLFHVLYFITDLELDES